VSAPVSPTPKGRWEPHNEEIRRLYFVKHKTREEIKEETGHSLKTIDKTIAKVEQGLAPPLPGGVPPDREEEVLPAPEEEVQLHSAVKTVGKQVAVKETDDFSEANLLRIVPRSFTAMSTTIWIAMQIAAEQWGWKVRSPGEFLDRFLTQAMEDYGFKIHGYMVLPWASVAPKKAQGDGNVEQPEKNQEVSEWTGDEND
jgi:hypothetical protein